MANLRAIRTRIRSVSSTKKITRAMQMVAAARLRRSQESLEKGRPYLRKLEELLGQLLSGLAEERHPLMIPRPVKRRTLVVLSSDRGLCGAFNSSLFRLAEEELKKEDPPKLVLIGKKARTFFKRRKVSEVVEIDSFWTDFAYGKAAGLACGFAEEFLNGEIDQVDLLYNEFISVISQRPTVRTLLPCQPISAKAKDQEAPEEEAKTLVYTYEPSEKELLAKLTPRAVEVGMYVATLNALVSEHGARMTAMDAATRNAGEMIDRLTLHLNRSRQAAITKELVEIVSGAEAVH